MSDRMNTPSSRGFFMLIMLTLSCEKETTFKIRESVEQLHITHAMPREELQVVNNGKQVASGTVDEQGSLMFRNIPPGAGYVVKTKSNESSRALTVMSMESSQPDPQRYAQQELKAGYNYLTMRDGTTLSAWVTLPPGKGPFPTVVNYSGYNPSEPRAPNPDFAFLCDDFPVLCTPPTDPSALYAGMLGYATVSVNMRGTGCSGGAYDYFETMQLLDGYDVIEIAAAQSFALHHQVGMVGLSFPGISQLFVASLRPPGLSAIAPMSVIGSTDSTFLPGGILNDGFAVKWVKEVLKKAVPFGQGWERKRVDAGDTVCAENQLLHSQLVDNVAQAKQIAFYRPEVLDRLNPAVFAEKINVPVFLVGAWQDEQTGPYFFLLFDKFVNAPALRVTATNGVHIEGFGPYQLLEWHTFLELFVAKRVPLDPVKFRNISSLLYGAFFKSPLKLPAARFSSSPTYADALAAWKAEPPFDIRFENGAGRTGDPGAPEATFGHRFKLWPPSETSPLELHFQRGARLSAVAPIDSTSSSEFTLAPLAGATGVLAPNANVWDKLPKYNWAPQRVGEAAVFEGEPLLQDTVFSGTASFDVWLKSPVDDADLEVTLSEVRPDGQEMYVQSGWLRASYRQPGPRATRLWPAQTLLESDWSPLPIGVWTPVRVGTAAFAHVMRAGSRIRVSIDTPGGVRAEWRFSLKTFPQTVAYQIGHDVSHPSTIVLPRVSDVSVSTPLPACPSLRGQPCRPHVPAQNIER
jgi:uncharacterized protein